MPAPYITQVAKAVPFDNSTNGFASQDVQAAIEEVQTNVTQSASPGFTWGRSGTINAGAYLLNDTVPSNKTGRPIPVTNGFLKRITVSNESPATFDIKIQEHDGVVFTDLTTVSLVSQRSKVANVNVAITQGKELAVLVSSGQGKEIVVGVNLSGTIV